MNHSQQATAEVEQQLLVSRTKYSELKSQFNLLKVQMEQNSKDAEERMVDLMKELAVLETNNVEFESVRDSMKQEVSKNI